jgi:hypothetical protein
MEAALILEVSKDEVKEESGLRLKVVVRVI